MKFRVPIRCRWFGHKFQDTEHELQIGPLDFMKSPLQRCERCKVGRLFQLVGFAHFTPQAVDEYLAVKYAAKNENVIVGRFRRKGVL